RPGSLAQYHSDKKPDAATTYLSLEHIPWPNYHDAGGSLGKAFGRSGIPLAVVIDADGKILFYTVGDDIAALRAALGRFGPPRIIHTCSSGSSASAIIALVATGAALRAGDSRGASPGWGARPGAARFPCGRQIPFPQNTETFESQELVHL